MSTQAIAGAIDAPDLLAASQRVQQLQALVSEAGRGIPTASFAAALTAASARAQTGAPMVASSTNPALPTVSPTASGTLATTAYGSTPNAAGTAGTAAAYPATSPGGPATPQPTSGGSSPYDSLISQAAARYGLDPAILHGLIQQESGFNANSQSSAGAAGLTQLMPGTASSLGVSNPLDPAQSIAGGARYLSQMMSQFGGNIPDALAAYNAGPGAVKQYGGVPPYAETQDYVTKVLGYAEAYRQSGSTTANTGQIT